MMVIYNLKKWVIKGLCGLTLLLIFQNLFAGKGNSGQIEAPFNLTEIIEKVSHHPIKEGNKIMIKDATYEAYFDESGVILKARNVKNGAKDLFIPINGKPEIEEGKVIYRTKEGEVIFEGRKRGLIFEEKCFNPDSRIINNYSGNVAKLKVGKTCDGLKTGEFLIDTNVVYIPAPYEQSFPSVAFGGTNYLVVWRDSRSGSYDIYGARVSPSGVVLDPAGIAISTATYDQRSPSVAFDGTNYLVVWMDKRNDPNYYDIYGARVSTNGVVLDPDGIPISTAAYAQLFPSVAFDGINYLVVWEDYRSGSSDIYGARVSTSGVVLDPDGIPISTAAYWQYSPSVAFDGTNYLVVWEDHRSGSYDIYGARVSTSGVVLDPDGIPISTAAYSQWFPSVAFDGINYLVVWEDYRSGSSDIYGARVSTNGVVLDPDGIPISTAAYWQYSPSVAFDGTIYLVVWEDSRSGSWDIYGARVSTSGVVLDPDGIPISTAAYWQYSPSVAFDGTNYLVVWEDHRSGSYDIYGARVSTSGVVLDPDGIVISTVAYRQWFPSVAFDGTNYLVVWEDSRSGSSDIYGARVSTSGVVLDPDGIAISTAAYYQVSPSVAFDGTNYLVVWEDSRSGSWDIYGARVSTSGVVLDPDGIPISTAMNYQGFPSVAFDGTNYLVVWEDSRSGSYSDIYGARVSTSGVVLDPAGIAISTAADSQVLPSVAFDGTNYLVVWEDSRSGVSHIYGARVSTSGVVLDPAGIAISTAAYSQYSPSVAFDGANYLVVWEENRSGFSHIYGARVSKNGTVLDPNGIPISIAAGGQWAPSVAFDGTNYLVVWEDYRNNPSYPDIYGAKVSPEGYVIEEFPVSTQPNTQLSPALAHGPGNQILITYSGFVDYINNHPANTMRIWGKFYPFPKIEEKINVSKEFIYLHIQPNPFNSFTKIKYYLPKSSNVILKIYDVKGECLKTFVNGRQNAGIYEIKWDRKNDRDKKICEGIYFLRLETNDCTITNKMIIMP